VPTSYATTNVTNTRNIFGPDLASISGKMVQWTPAPVVVDYVALLRLLVEANLIVTLAEHVLRGQNSLFYSRSQGGVPVQTAKCLGKHLKQVLEVCG
jgi:hypothetical protein